MNVIGTQLRDPIVSTRFSLSMEISRLARDGTTEPVSRDQILRREREQEIFIFPVQLTTCRIGNLTRSIHTLATCVTIHAYSSLLVVWGLQITYT